MVYTGVMPRGEKGRYLRAFVRILVVGGLVISSGCGPKDDTLDFSGQPGQAVDLEVVADTPAVEVSLKVRASDTGYRQGLFLLDTGSPVTLLEQTVYGVDTGFLRLSELFAFELRFFDLKVGAMDLFGSSSLLTGIIGGDVFRHFTLAVDYRHALTWLFDEYDGDPPVTVGQTAAPFVVGFSLLGGGVLVLPDGDEMEARATRVTVTAEVEGRAVTAVVDTGASAPVLEGGLAGQLFVERPDRPRLDGIEVTTVDGRTSAFITRVTSLAVGEAEVVSVPCLVPENTQVFYFLSREVGRTVSLLIGGSFLRSFFTVIDYPGRKLMLAPYTVTDHIDPEEYVFVGFQMEQAPGRVQVALVYPGTDAEAKGIRVGDEVASIDGQAVTDVAQAYGLVAAHSLGEEVSLGLVRQGAPLSLSVLVEDLLPEFSE